MRDFVFGKVSANDKYIRKYFISIARRAIGIITDRWIERIVQLLDKPREAGVMTTIITPAILADGWKQ